MKENKSRFKVVKSLTNSYSNCCAKRVGKKRILRDYMSLSLDVYYYISFPAQLNQVDVTTLIFK